MEGVKCWLFNEVASYTKGVRGIQYRSVENSALNGPKSARICENAGLSDLRIKKKMQKIQLCTFLKGSL